MSHSTETEQRIIASAEKVFYRKGRAGTSMQDIADDAGINRTLLNYYFRTKDQLFEAVFRSAMGRFVPQMGELMHSDRPFEEYMPVLVERVIDTMIDNPQIPFFVLQELSSNPERMPQMMREMGFDPELATRKLSEEKALAVDMGLDPRQVMLNVISLCIFPFAARPVVSEILFGGDQEAFIAAMEERKKLIPAVVKQILLQNPKS